MTLDVIGARRIRSAIRAPDLAGERERALSIDAGNGEVRCRAGVVANPLLVEFRVATGANLAVQEQVDVVEQALFLTLDDQGAIVGIDRRSRRPPSGPDICRTR